MEQPGTESDKPLARVVQRDAMRDLTETSASTLPHMEAITALISAQVTAAAQRRREAAERPKTL
jgi:hypothetical protein